MTDILTIVVEKKLDVHSSNYQSIFMQVLNTNKISFTKINNQQLQFIIPFSLLEQTGQILPFYDYFYIGIIFYQNKVLSLSANVFSSEGNQIKASSIHHKTFLSKFSMNLNKKNHQFQIKVNPINGQIKLQISFLINDQSYISQALYHCLINLRNQTSTTIKILQALESDSTCGENNPLFLTILQRIESLRIVILGIQQPTLKGQTESQKEHKIAFLIDQNPSIRMEKSANPNMIQKMKKTYVEGFINMFVHSSTKVKIQNFSYLAFDPTPNLKSLLKNIQQSKNLPIGSIVDEFSVEKQPIRVQLNPLRAQNINYQHSILDKISKKRIYLSFLREYFIVRNHLQLTNHFLLTKKESFQLQTVHKFLQQNSLSLSFETKLKIVSQIVCICCICLERLENFQPDFSLNNFYMDQNFQFRFKSIGKSEINSKDTLIQVVYKVIFERKYFQTKNDEVLKKKIISIENNHLKQLGPSMVLKILLKVVQNYQKSDNKKGQNLIENMLLVINRISDLFQKVLEGVQQNPDF